MPEEQYDNPEYTLSQDEIPPIKLGKTALSMIGIRNTIENPKADLSDFNPAESKWIDLAACKNSSPALFFQDEGKATIDKLAKDVCRTCFVENVCLEYALTKPEEHGIWGGTGPTERRIMRRVRARQTRLNKI